MVAQGIRVVATADNHLNRFYDRLSPEKLRRRRQYLRQGFRAAVEHALQWPAHLFVIAGDLFDQPDPRNVDRAFVADCLARLRAAGISVFAIGGNHDTPRQSTVQGGAAPQEIYGRLGALTFFDDPTRITTAVVEVAGLRIAIGGLAPDPLAPDGVDPLEDLAWEDRPPDADLAILVLHAGVEGYMPPGMGGPVVHRHTLLTFPGVDLFVVGDIHRPAIERYGKRLLVIPGATERMTFGEDPHVPGFVALTLAPGGMVAHERIQLAGQPRAELTVRTSELGDDPLDDLVQRLAAVCTPETMVRLRLDGSLTRERYHALQLRQLHEAIQPRAFSLTIDTGGLLIEDEQHLSAERGVRLAQQDELRQYAAELMVEAGDDAGERALLEAAAARLLERY